jgi:L-lactate dehydrogenase complex protein LldF
VYERTGGHAYGSIYPGPIGAVLTPQLTGIADNPSLPFASTLCGACADVCPVRIDLPGILVHLRNAYVRTRPRSPEAFTMSLLGWFMTSPRRFSVGQRLSRVGRLLGRRNDRITTMPPPLSAWTATRDAPRPPVETFREWWARERGPTQ